MLYDHGSTQGHPKTKAIWAASPNGLVRKLYDTDLDIHQIQGWLSNSSFVEQTLRYYPPYYHSIYIVDILAGTKTPLYPCFGSVHGISSTGDVLMKSDGFEVEWANTEALQRGCSNPLVKGFYVYKDGNFIAIPQEIIAAKWYSELNSFLLPTEAGLEIRDIFGQVMVDFPGDRCFPTLSEDRQWLAFMYPCAKDHEESRRVSIYNLEGALQMKTTTEVDNLYWNPDSSGLFLLTGSQLSFFSRLDGETTLLHPDIGVEWLVVVGPSAN
jgi:hypothetical protein